MLCPYLKQDDGDEWDTEVDNAMSLGLFVIVSVFKKRLNVLFFIPRTMMADAEMSLTYSW